MPFFNSKRLNLLLKDKYFLHKINDSRPIKDNLKSLDLANKEDIHDKFMILRKSILDTPMPPYNNSYGRDTDEFISKIAQVYDIDCNENIQNPLCRGGSHKSRRKSRRSKRKRKSYRR